MTGEPDSFEALARHLAQEHGPILGAQAAALGAERFTRFTQGHAQVQAMSMFLIMSVSTVPQTGYSDEALDALRQDARDVREVADRWAADCERLADHWQAQRQENQP